MQTIINHTDQPDAKYIKATYSFFDGKQYEIVQVSTVEDDFPFIVYDDIDNVLRFIIEIEANTKFKDKKFDRSIYENWMVDWCCEHPDFMSNHKDVTIAFDAIQFAIAPENTAIVRWHKSCLRTDEDVR